MDMSNLPSAGKFRTKKEKLPHTWSFTRTFAPVVFPESQPSFLVFAQSCVEMRSTLRGAAARNRMAGRMCKDYASWLERCGASGPASDGLKRPFTAN
ncbi:hypothetical protein M3J09_003428 [Ascochyta lentis]